MATRNNFREQFGTLVTVISPVGWMAIVGIIIVFTGLGIWSLYGRIDEIVIGKGILIDTDGINDVEVVTGGEINYISVDVGDYVRAGQPVARLQQPGLEEQISQRKSEVALLESFLTQATALYLEKHERNRKYLNSVHDNLTSNLKDMALSRDALLELKDIYQDLAKRTVIPKYTYIEIVRNYLNSEVIFNNINSSLVEIPFRSYMTEFEDQRILTDTKLRLSNMKYELAQLQERFNNYSIIRSPADGYVREVASHDGDVVKTGDILLTLSNESTRSLKLVAFLSPYQGKMVKIGMDAKIAPSTVKPEQFGYIQGKVTSVSEYPQSSRAQTIVIRNVELVEELTSHKPSIRVELEMLPAINTPSKLKWTSSLGPPDRIRAGTICQVRITYQSMPPLAYFIPAMKKLLGME